MKITKKLYIAAGVALTMAAGITTASAVSPYISRVLEFCPAPGQFVNEVPEVGTDAGMAAQVCTENLSGQASGDMISLGAWGGYVVFEFDHPLVNVAGEYDFRINGNSFGNGVSGGSSEPGTVWVSVDANRNGLADDEWYELAGSEHSNPATVHGYEITYFNPAFDSEGSPERVRWADNQGATGFIEKNISHSQSYWPEWLSQEKELHFKGTRLPDNAVDKDGNGKNWILHGFAWGYADNIANADDPGFKLDWAVDAAGNSVLLSEVDFIKVQTAVRQTCGWLGETSTEILGAIDLHPDAVSSVAELSAGCDLEIIHRSKDILNVCSGEGGLMQIYSADGSLAFTVVLKAGEQKVVDLSGMPGGMYVIRKGMQAIKFVK